MCLHLTTLLLTDIYYISLVSKRVYHFALLPYSSSTLEHVLYSFETIGSSVPITLLKVACVVQFHYFLTFRSRSRTPQLCIFLEPVTSHFTDGVSSLVL